MDELAVMRVSGVVVALMYLLRWAGVPPRWAPLLVPALSASGVAVWAYANAPVSQPETFSYLAGWVTVAVSAATAWGFTTVATAKLASPKSSARPRHRRRQSQPARHATRQVIWQAFSQIVTRVTPA
jgi:hypothetical protein